MKIRILSSACCDHYCSLIISFPLDTASKHAFQAFFDSLRSEVHDKNITVSVLSPSYIRTNISINAVRADGSQYNGKSFS